MKSKIIKIVPLCRLRKSPKGKINKIYLSNIIHSSIEWTEDSLRNGKLWYRDLSYRGIRKVKITRCKIIEVEYIYETYIFIEFPEDGVITRSRNLTIDDMNNIHKNYSKKFGYDEQRYFIDEEYYSKAVTI